MPSIIIRGFKNTGGGGVTFTYEAKSADFTAVNNHVYGVDTSAGIVTGTLPANAAVSSIIFFSDEGVNFGTHKFIVAAAPGETVLDLPFLEMTGDYEAIGLIKSDQNNWVLLGTQPTGSGGGGASLGYESVSVDFTAALSRVYGVDTSNGAVTCTLPTAAPPASIVYFTDEALNFSTHKFTIAAPAGEAVSGLAFIELTNDREALALIKGLGSGWSVLGTESSTVIGEGPVSNVDGTRIVNGTSEAGFATPNGDLQVTINSLNYGRLAPDNIFLGVDAGSLTVGTNNIALGNYSLELATLANNNVAIGYLSLSKNIQGDDNVAVGGRALSSSTTGHSNTSVGAYSMQFLTTGFRNVALGTEAALVLTAGSDNGCFGYYSGGSLTTGSDNVLVGTSAGGDLSIGDGNVAVGVSSLLNATTGEYNVALGEQSLVEITTGIGNIGLGLYGGWGIGTGSYNVAIGNRTGPINRGTSQCVAIGTYALNGQSIGSNGDGNIAVGSKAANRLLVGQNNIILGTEAHGEDDYSILPTTLTGSNNIIFGYRARPSAAVVSNEITLGNNAITSFRIPGLGFTLSNVSSATNGQALIYDLASGAWIPGTVSGGGGLSNRIQNGTSKVEIPVIDDRIMFTVNNVVVGSLEGSGALVAENGNVIFGSDCCSAYSADPLNKNLYDNVALGRSVLSGADSITNCVVIGRNTGENLLGATSSIIVGDRSVQGAGWFLYSLAMGDYILESATDVQGTVAIGSGALSDTTTSLENTCVGWGSAPSNTTGIYLTTLGSQSLRNNTVGSRNTAIGMCSLFNNITGNNNTGLGAFAGAALNSGGSNLYLGAYSGAQPTLAPSGFNTSNPPFNNHNNVTLIGYNAQASSVTASNEITLGNSAVTTFRIPGLGFTLGNLTPATNGQALVYDGTTGTWVPGAVAGTPGADGTDGADGAPGADGQSAYQLALQLGFVGTEAQWLESLNGDPGAPGLTAYATAVQLGFVGTEAEWLESLIGPPGGLGGSSIYTLNLVGVAAGQTVVISRIMPKIVLVHKVTSNCSIRIRQYLDEDYRTDDLARASTTPITGDHGCYYDLITKSERSFIRNLAPPATAVSTGTGFFSITNLETTPQTLNIQITALTLES